MNKKIVEQPIIDIINDIKNNSLSVKKLNQDDKERCVEFLMSKGYEDPQIAKFLSVSERTVRRYIEKLGKRNALRPSVEFAEVVIGNCSLRANKCIERLVKIINEPNTTQFERIAAINCIWKINKELMEILQRLGYLPYKTSVNVEREMCYVSLADATRAIKRSEPISITGDEMVDEIVKQDLSPQDREKLRKNIEKYIIAKMDGDKATEKSMLVQISDESETKKKMS